MQFPKHVVVTEQEIDLVLVSDTTKEGILTLAEELTQYVRENTAKRLIVGFAGPSGAGKSLVAECLRQLLSEALPSVHTEAVTIDAFHFPNSELKQKGLLLVKGRYDTYDVPQLHKKLDDFLCGAEVLFPQYSRKLHEPILDVITIATGEPAVILLDGLWLLLREHGWETIGPLLTRSYYLESAREDMRTRTIERHIRGGRSLEDAEHFYHDSDRENTNLIETTKANANIVLQLG